MELLTCENLSVRYGSKTIFTDLSFRVCSGDYLCIIGDNGAGKSTLMKTILGLHKEYSGKIDFHENFSGKGIGYLPQQNAIQKDFPASVWEVVFSGFQKSCGFRPFYTKAEKQKAMSWMKKMGILSLAKKCYRELSGGQQQRVLLSRALCATEGILLLDEPVSGLDPQVTQDLYNLIYDLNQNEGITVIMISHDIKAATSYASHILRVGAKSFFGTNEEFIKGGICNHDHGHHRHH